MGGIICDTHLSWFRSRLGCWYCSLINFLPSFSLKVLCGGVLTGGELIITLLQSLKNLSSDGAGVGGVIYCDSCIVGEETVMSLLPLPSLLGLDDSSSCPSL